MCATHCYRGSEQEEWGPYRIYSIPGTPTNPHAQATHPQWLGVLTNHTLKESAGTAHRFAYGRSNLYSKKEAHFPVSGVEYAPMKIFIMGEKQGASLVYPLVLQEG